MVPSVVKIKKGNVEYTSRVDIAKYTIKELNRRALMDVGRYIVNNVRLKIKKFYPFTRTRLMANRYQYWVPRKEGVLIVGMENIKKGAKTAWWADQMEQDNFIYSPSSKPRKRRRTYEELEMDAMQTRSKWKRFLAHQDALARGRESRAAARAAGITPSKKTPDPHNPKRHIMERFIKQHTDEIADIVSHYMGKLNGENVATAIAESIEEMEVLRGDEN